MKMRHVTTLSDFNMALSETALPTAQVLLKEIHNSEARLQEKTVVLEIIYLCFALMES